MSLAQMPDFSAFAQFGLSGIMFGSLMYFLIPAMRRLERSMDWLTMAHHLNTIAVAEANEVTKARAREALAEVEAKHRKERE